jgi:hypothetical protein
VPPGHTACYCDTPESTTAPHLPPAPCDVCARLLLHPHAKQLQSIIHAGHGLVGGPAPSRQHHIPIGFDTHNVRFVQPQDDVPLADKDLLCLASEFKPVRLVVVVALAWHCASPTAGLAAGAAAATAVCWVCYCWQVCKGVPVPGRVGTPALCNCTGVMWPRRLERSSGLDNDAVTA